MSSTQKFAIVGINCRLPGARDVGEYWSNLKAGTDSITTWSLEELIDAGIDPEMAKNPAYVKARPQFADVEKFDACFFRFTPREAEIRDPQHRLFPESVYTALEDVGYDPFSVPGRVGVFAGSAPNAYEPQNVRHHQERVQALGQMTVSIGNTNDYVAPTVSYKLGLTGPSVNVVTACSSSLVAVHMACRSLMNGECETAVAGGVEVEPPVVSGYWSAEGGIYSKSGHCRPFDHEADGTIFGTGVGTVVLRRLQDAVRDNDNVYAVILGSAVNNDAADRAGFTAPSNSGQRALMEAGFADADAGPSIIDYIEAHGTGTIVGGQIEVTAHGETFAAHGVTPESRSLAGSVKGNIGHMGPVAGVDPRSVQRAADLADRPGACRVTLRGALSARVARPSRYEAPKPAPRRSVCTPDRVRAARISPYVSPVTCRLRSMHVCTEKITDAYQMLRPERDVPHVSCGTPAVRLNRACALAGCCRPLAAARGLRPGSRRPCQSPPVSSGPLAVRNRRRNI
ncbi:polyketide synthase [Streptomyces sp. 110]|uniref:Polyketide synthase n=1 Tax=Streptomyces endocoffeicus TaxID=2898945 RepID=A0ABS1Q395_9ACTN|nr:polyketide synthase [Streptomyces endocoffeicus]MBL1118657.1 polyketide synthase [Streptomyces endocoffeicus]